ncbi:hypothetical protein [Nodularia sphaerocarpa]|uniref:hypothetical protein n=1 Tax=Nodularia sphaerocarpa TaxID=137816 RepID=UPI00232D09C8|nr:hypothetical protein [Nodularia sphaerocarpa]MDB9373273.1 hypothetical protein [Nodularia sphaerocarpa CS-585]MDB9378418.1 hypothetical protein [Nodularia sphaerocarpa CS-585A2]
MILDNHRPTTVFKQQANQQDTQQVQNLDDSSQQRLEQLEQRTEAIALTFHGMWKRKSGSRIEVANHSPSFFVFRGFFK